MASLRSDIIPRLKLLMPFIGNINLDKIHRGTLDPFILAMQKRGLNMATINHGLKIVRRILNLAASEWIDPDTQLTWLAHAPKIRFEKVINARKPYPLSWEEQDRLFHELPDYLKKMALFAVNTGLRSKAICSLRWEWENRIDENYSIFIIPDYIEKTHEDKPVVLNQVAMSILESVRGEHADYVFTYKKHSISRINNKAWQNARIRAGLKHVRVHDLRHTYGCRLRSAGVDFEDRQDLLGHKSSRMTTHYSGAEIYRLIEAANRVCERTNCGPILRQLTQSFNIRSRKTPARHLKLVAG